MRTRLLFLFSFAVLMILLNNLSYAGVNPGWCGNSCGGWFDTCWGNCPVGECAGNCASLVNGCSVTCTPYSCSDAFCVDNGNVDDVKVRGMVFIDFNGNASPDEMNYSDTNGNGEYDDGEPVARDSDGDIICMQNYRNVRDANDTYCPNKCNDWPRRCHAYSVGEPVIIPPPYGGGTAPQISNHSEGQLYVVMYNGTDTLSELDKSLSGSDVIGSYRLAEKEEWYFCRLGCTGGTGEGASTPIYSTADKPAGTYWYRLYHLASDWEVTGIWAQDENDLHDDHDVNFTCTPDSSDPTFVKCTFSGEGNIRLNWGIKPTNKPPVCSISGPSQMVGGTSEKYTSTFTDPEGASPVESSCDWTASAGTFVIPFSMGVDSESCTGATYTTPNEPASRTLTFEASDGENMCPTVSKSVEVLTCGGYYTPTSQPGVTKIGDVYWLSSTLSQIDVDYQVIGAGPRSLDRDETDILLRDTFIGGANCGSIANVDSNPMRWNFSMSGGRNQAAGTDCTLNGSITMIDDYPGDIDQPNTCPQATYHINSAPSCGDFDINSSGPFNVCDPFASVVLTSNATDDGGPNSSLQYTWTITCTPNNGDPAGVKTYNYPVSDSNVLVYQPTGNIHVTGETCEFSVSVSDGFDVASCPSDQTFGLTYTHDIQFDVESLDINYSEFTNNFDLYCNADATDAIGVRVTLSNAHGYSREIVDGAGADFPDGMVTFTDLSPTGEETTTYTYGISYRPECAPFRVGGEFIEGSPTCRSVGADYFIDVTPTPCTTKRVNLNLYEEETERWMTSINGDAYSESFNFNSACADKDATQTDFDLPNGFSASLLGFTDPENPDEMEYAFAHIASSPLTLNDFDYLCPTDTSDDTHCGAAALINNFSGYFNSLDIFNIPSYIKGDSAYQISSFLPSDNPFDAGKVYWMTANDFNNMFTAGNPVYIYMSNPPGASVIYVENGADLVISEEIFVEHTGGNAWRKPQRMILITNNNVTIDKNVGYGAADEPIFGGNDGYKANAVPNIDMAIMTSGKITIDGDGENDYPIMLRGPFVAETIELKRDLWTNNDMYPAASVMYNTSVLSKLTEAQRKLCSEDLFGIELFDVQFIYE